MDSVSFGDYLLIFVSIIVVKNMVLARFLGLCPFIGVSKKSDAALGMGIAVTFVMTLASVATWLIYRFLLIPSESNILYLIGSIFGDADPASYNFIDILRTLTFILVIASLVQFVEMVIRKVSPPLYESLGIYLPLITTNCAVMGIALINSDMFFKDLAASPGLKGATSGSFFLAVVQGFGAGIGFTLVMMLMSGIREHLEKMPVPAAFKGVPISFVCTGCMALAFTGFAGMVSV